MVSLSFLFIEVSQTDKTFFLKFNLKDIHLKFALKILKLWFQITHFNLVSIDKMITAITTLARVKYKKYTFDKG